MIHPAQLRICHERIDGALGSRERQWCSLGAYAWCFSCGNYVCDLHRAAKHDDHDTVIEFPLQRSSVTLEGTVRP